jgi:hypothetical protein
LVNGKSSIIEKIPVMNKLASTIIILVAIKPKSNQGISGVV